MKPLNMKSLKNIISFIKLLLRHEIIFTLSYIHQRVNREKVETSNHFKLAFYTFHV